MLTDTQGQTKKPHATITADNLDDIRRTQW